MEPITTLTTDQQEQILAALAARSGMYSPKFWTRAFAIWGHNIAAAAVVYIVFGLLTLFYIGVTTLAGK